MIHIAGVSKRFGSVSIGGRVVNDATRRIFIPPERRGLGMIFQDFAFRPHMTVFENEAYTLRARRPCVLPERSRVSASRRTRRELSARRLGVRRPRWLSAVCFGHWAGLGGVDSPPIHGVDVKCAGSGQLALLHLEIRRVVTVGCAG